MQPHIHQEKENKWWDIINNIAKTVGEDSEKVAEWMGKGLCGACGERHNRQRGCQRWREASQAPTNENNNGRQFRSLRQYSPGLQNKSNQGNRFQRSSFRPDPRNVAAQTQDQSSRRKVRIGPGAHLRRAEITDATSEADTEEEEYAEDLCTTDQQGPKGGLPRGTIGQ